MIEAVFAEEWPRLVASLVRRFGDVDVAEEAAGEAVAAAVESWRGEEPPNPGGWLMTTATRKAIDRLRREARGRELAAQAAVIDVKDPYLPSVVEDDTLRLVFTCCHPALAPESRVALTLRLVGGLTTAEIARAFLVSEPTMTARLTRAKKKIREAHIPYRVPDLEELPDRLGAVLAVLYLIFNEGYLASSGDDPIRADLSGEAIRLTRLLDRLMPDVGEVDGLLALMLLTEARRASRLGVNGELVMIDDQDRGAWDRALIDEGLSLVATRVAASHSGERPGPYQLQAAISAVHTSAPSFDSTDWSQIVQLYDQLLAVNPNPIVALNRAVAIGEVEGADVALALVEALDLASYQPWHAARADLLRRLERPADAREAYDEAISRCTNPGERRFLIRRRDNLGP
jgi:RNA polymerase sigma-70 factor (ECF subfamily)